MSILEKLNKVIMEKDGAAAAEIIHDDYKRYSHLQGTLEIFLLTLILMTSLIQVYLESSRNYSFAEQMN